jgi:hypothetical protein
MIKGTAHISRTSAFKTRAAIQRSNKSTFQGIA